MKKNKKIILWILGTMAALILILYLSGCFYFSDHFFFNTSLNGKDISLKNVRTVEQMQEEEIQQYELVIKEKDSAKERITRDSIQLKYDSQEEIKKLLDKQNSFFWFISPFSPTSFTSTAKITYNEGALKKVIESLQCYSEEEIPPQNAVPEFNGEQYVIKEEVTGHGIEKENLTAAIIKSVDSLTPEIDLEKENYYLHPEYTKESPEVIKACETLNQYIKASVTYTMDVPVVIDKQVISGWLSIDDTMAVTLDENAIKNWLTEFGDKYDTLGTTRTFTTPNGKAASVTGGTYGWSIDEDTEFTTILNAVKNGETITKDPTYYAGGTASVHTIPDWGSTYIDVDLSQQYMWYVVNGSVALETPVVTGEPIPEKVTPEGVYSILEKSLDTVLVGEILPGATEPEYRTHVDYWMRATWTGIGFHDATWQPYFGGDLYTWNGSHGCINMPLDQASALYNMVDIGTPVVIHY